MSELDAVYGGGAGAATAVVLHGAGNGSKERLLPLLGEFVARGCGGPALDFSGHGKTRASYGS
ncbi:hypothetical protein ACFV80_15205 [Streptomyces sp. NPDC059862]|uniref:hypothetical protein n=1 Tax=Streptomyces sp. NPDC059862 TaxID=3346975 RepID=UPI0036534FD9